MSLGTCEECGRLIYALMAMHDCKPCKNHVCPTCKKKDPGHLSSDCPAIMRRLRKKVRQKGR